MIVDRVLEIIDLKNINKSTFYKLTGLSNGFLDKVKDIGASKIESILNVFEDINPEWLITGKGSMLKTEVKDPGLIEKGIPLYDLTATASVVGIFSDTKLQIPIDHINIPNLPKCDGAIHVTGDSMYPLLKAGDMVLYKHLNDKRNIIWGEMYIMYINDHGDEFFFVKYIHKSDQEGYVKLVSQNQHHEAVEFPIDSIKQIAIVKASVRINSQV